MKNHCVLAPFALAIAAVTAAPAGAQEVLTGDTRLACEATLCLATGTRPGECSPSLSRYFSINKRKWSDTVRARANFLSLCPVSDQTPEMRSLVNAMANGAGRCDAASLNVTLRVWNHWDADGGRVFINNQMPGYCAAYTGHQYTKSGRPFAPVCRDAGKRRLLGRCARPGRCRGSVQRSDCCRR
jgi:hypothetical protein